MKADWEDAPARVRGKSNKLFLKLLFTVAGVVLLAAWIPQHLGKTVGATQASKGTQPITGNNLDSKRPSKHMGENPYRPIVEAVEDPYLEQVNRMLGITDDYVPAPTAEIEWAEPEPVQRAEKQQNVFTDSNYTPPATVNTVRMPKPKPLSAQPQKRQQPYVTVVKETKLSCWPFKEGSTQCRRHKSQLHQIWRKNCDTGSNSQSHSCRMAKRYDLR